MDILRYVDAPDVVRRVDHSRSALQQVVKEVSVSAPSLGSSRGTLNVSMHRQDDHVLFTSHPTRPMSRVRPPHRKSPVRPHLELTVGRSHPVYRSSTQPVRRLWPKVLQRCDQSQRVRQPLCDGDRPYERDSGDGRTMYSSLRRFVSSCSRVRPLSSADQNGMMGSMMQDLAFAIPGVDEAMSFAEIMK